MHLNCAHSHMEFSLFVHLSSCLSAVGGNQIKHPEGKLRRLKLSHKVQRGGKPGHSCCESTVLTTKTALCLTLL